MIALQAAFCAEIRQERKKSYRRCRKGEPVTANKENPGGAETYRGRSHKDSGRAHQAGHSGRRIRQTFRGPAGPYFFEDETWVPEDLRLAYRFLKNAGFVPPELELRNEIITLRDLIETIDDDKEKLRRPEGAQTSKLQKFNMLREKALKPPKGFRNTSRGCLKKRSARHPACFCCF